jgi:hypothetical protein
MASGGFLAREVASFWAWEGSDAMLAPHQLWTFAGNEATHALDSLVERIRSEVQSYRDKAISLGDSDRRGRAEDTTKWLSGPGSSIITEIRDKILAAEPERKNLMRASLESAVRLADIEQSRDMEAMDNWDMVLQWAEEILLVVRRSFHSYPTREARHEEMAEANWVIDSCIGDLLLPEFTGSATYQDVMSDWPAEARASRSL